MALALSPGRVDHHQEDEDDGRYPDYRSDPQSPVPVSGDFGCLSSDNVAQAAADRDGEVEDGQHPATHVFDEHVADDGGGDGAVAGLTNTHHSSASEELPVVRISPAVFLSCL